MQFASPDIDWYHIIDDPALGVCKPSIPNLPDSLSYGKIIRYHQIPAEDQEGGGKPMKEIENSDYLLWHRF
ncbi:hypothetical protein [Nitrosomonas sp.]|uniref:hypothetical protein n=1 Tax=Nitrosomonas sp. TaxID=42353 RepID=UPI0033067C38